MQRQTPPAVSAPLPRPRAVPRGAHSRGAVWATLILGMLACNEADPNQPSEPPAGEPDATAEAGSTEAPKAPEPDASTSPPSSPPEKRDAKDQADAYDGDYVYAKSRFTWIQEAPRASKGWLGYLTYGSRVRVKGGDADAATTPGYGCDRWVAIEPMGYVCVGANATTDPSDPVVVALRENAADVTSPWPYRYAESIGAPRYRALPTPEEQRATEWDLERHRDQLARAKGATAAEVEAINEWLVGVDPSPTGTPAPTLLAMGAKVVSPRAHVQRGSTIAFTRMFDHGDRSWLYTADHAFVPKDRVRLYDEVPFTGVSLSETDGLRLPLAFVRRTDRPLYRRSGEGVETTDQTLPRLSVRAIGEPVEVDGTRYYEVAENGLLAAEEDLVIIRSTPKEKAPFSPKERDALQQDASSARFTWVEISVLDGWLVAYEGYEPVFATLISPGRGGVPVPGIPAIETAATPVGTFRVDGKFQTATMVSSTDSNIVHDEVQFVQNFHGPHALHGAYWHNAWGEKKSGGCVNLSPKDAKWLFAWSEPQLPTGWHGLRSVPEVGRATTVVVHP